jgi:hypothetical protein
MTTDNDRTIVNWAQGFTTLYKKPDSSRKPEEFWNATMAHLSGIGEAIRRTHYLELMRSAVHTFCWMCCYISKCKTNEDKVFSLNNHFCEIVGLKFPKICGHCLSNKCVCNPVEMDSAKDKSAKYKDLYNHWKDIKWEDYTLNRWLDVFWNIYSGQIHLLTLENIGFHLLEEAGEEALAVRQLVQFRGIVEKNIDGIDSDFLGKISNIKGLVEEYVESIDSLKEKYKVKSEKEALKKIDYKSDDALLIKARLVKAKMDFVIEFADTFSWYCAVLLKLRKIIQEENLAPNIVTKFEIEAAIMDRYKSNNIDEPLTCYACGETACKCLFYPKTSLEGGLSGRT